MKKFRIFVEYDKIEIHFRGEWNTASKAKKVLEESKVEGADGIYLDGVSRYGIGVYKGKLYSFEEVIQNIKKVLESAGFTELKEKTEIEESPLNYEKNSSNIHEPRGY